MLCDIECSNAECSISVEVWDMVVLKCLQADLYLPNRPRPNKNVIAIYRKEKWHRVFFITILSFYLNS